MKKVEIQDQDFAKYLVRKNANSLELIRANDVPTREAAFSVFCEEISNPQITHIKVGGVEAGDFQFHDLDNFTLRLASAVKKNGNIEHLEVPMQRFASEGFLENLAIELGGKQQYAVSPKTAKSFCEALQTNPKLEYLDLVYSTIEDAALTDIILTLQQYNPHLSTLKMGFIVGTPNWGQNSIKALQSLVSNHKSLSVLDIADTFILNDKNSKESLFFMDAIENMVLANPKLTIKLAHLFQDKISANIRSVDHDIGNRLELVIKEDEAGGASFPGTRDLRAALDQVVKFSDLSDIIIGYTSAMYNELVILGVDAPEVDYLNQDAIA